MKQLCMLLIRGYRRFLSPLKPPTCRFHPTCSAYALEAYRLHGTLRGSWLTLKRVLRCQPFCRHGFDPVPGSDEARAADTISAAEPSTPTTR